MEGVLVTGQAHAGLDGECVRCLEEIHDELVADFQELFVYDESDTATLAGRGGRRCRPVGGRPARPRTTAAGRGGAYAAVPAAVPGRLSGPVPRVWGEARRRPGTPARRAGRPTVGEALRPRLAHDQNDRLTDRPTEPPRAADRGEHRGCPEAEDVAQQHAPPSLAVEGRRALAGDVRQPGLRRQAPAAPRLPRVRPVRRARRPSSGALTTTSDAQAGATSQSVDGVVRRPARGARRSGARMPSCSSAP